MHIFTKRISRFTLFLFILIVSSRAVYAQVPLNDDPCGAFPLTASASCNYATYTNVDASNSVGPGIPDPSPFILCGPYAGSDVWFTTTVPATATSVVIDTKNMGMGDGAMTVYIATGTCPTLTLTQIGCADDGSTNPGMPKLTITQPAGTVLYIRIYGVGGEMGTFGICVTANIPPVNDNCATATSLTVNPNLLCGTITAGTTNNATLSSTTPNPTCGTVNGWNDDVWYTFTATGPIHVVTLSNIVPATSMTMVVYSGPCSGFTQVGCANANTLTLNTLTAGSTYYVRVYTNTTTAGTTANFNICVGTPPPPPPNDECINATSLTVNPDFNCGTVTAGTTVSATQSSTIPTPTCSATNGWNDDVWYSFVATNAAHRVSLSNVTGITTDMVTAVYSGTCGALTQLACIDPDPNVVNLTGLTIGSTYYVRVMTWTATASSTASFNICVGTPPPPPANDNCPGAVSLTVNPTLVCGVVTAGSTISATSTTGVPAPSCSTIAAADDDVWFQFTATNISHRVSISNVSPANTIAMVVYSGTCGALLELGCSTATLMQVSGLIPGATYYVRVFTTSTTIGNNSNFNICVTTPPPPPANDECIAAVNLTVNPDYLCAVVTAGNTASATQSLTAPVPTCSPAGINDDVWFKFTATGITHRITLSNISGATPLTSVVYSGTCTALTQLNCSTINLYNVTGLTPGQTYYVRVFTTTNVITTDATFNICIGTPPPPPSNDECTGAISLTVNSDQLCGVVTAGSTEGATQSSTTPTPSCSALNGWNDDVWYSFVAVSNNHRVSLLGVTGTTTDMITTVYQGTCGNLTQIACTDPDPNVINLSTLTPGQTYYVRVQTASSGPVNANFNICVGTPGPGAVCSAGNPFCSTSGVVYPSVTGVGSLGGGTGSIYGCLLTTPNPTWFAFQVATPGNLVFNVTQTNTSGGGADVDYAAWGPFTSQANGCNQLATVTPPIQPISCSYSAAAVETITILNAQVGEWYIVLITNYSTQPGTISFTTTTGNVGSTNCNIVCNATAANNGPVCSGAQFNLTSTGLSGATFSWTGPGGFTSSQQNPTNITAPLTPGSYIYTVTTTSGSTSCSGTTTVVVTSTPAAPTVSTPVTYCQGTTSVPLSAGGTSLMWYTVPTGGTGSSTAPTPSTATVGSTTYYVSQGSGNCVSPRASIVVNVVASTTPAPGVISPVTYCRGAMATALTASGSGLLWYASAVGGTGSTTAPIPATGTVGSTTYYVSQNTGSCESPRSAITVTVNAVPQPPTTTNLVYCQNAATSPLTAGGIAPGATVLWYTAATAGTGSTTAPTPGNTASSTYYVTQTLNGCESAPRTALNITITPTPAAPTVSSTPIEYCQGATNAVPLTATAGNSLLWYTTATGGTGTSTLTPNTTATTTYYVSQITSGGCESPRTPLTVTVTPTPAAPAVTTPVIYCENATAAPLAATASAGNTIIYYTTATGGTGTATYTPSTATPGTFTYYASQITSGGCESPRASITVTVNALPAAPAVTSPVDYCQNAIAVPLTATGTNLLWYTTPTGGTGSTTAPTPSTAAAGSTTYYVSSTASNCEGPRAAIVVNISSLSAAPAVTTPVDYCQGATATQLTATGTNLLWYTAATGGTGSTTAPTPSTATAGSVTYYVSQTAAGECEGSRAAITVNVTATPAAPAVTTPVIYCENATAAPLAATASAGNTIIYYTTATGGTGTATYTPSTVTPGTFTYYASQLTSGGCESPRASIIVTVNATPPQPTVSNQTYCENATTSPLTAGGIAPGATVLWYTAATGGTGSTTAPTPGNTSSSIYYVTQTLNGCESTPRTALNITITPTPGKPSVVSPVKYCPDETPVPLTAGTAAGNHLLWYTTSTGGTGSLMPPTPVTSIQGNYYYYASQATANDCEGPRDTILVIVSNNNLSVDLGPDSTICQGRTVTMQPIVSPGTLTYEWRALLVPNTTIDSIFIKNATVNPVDNATYILKVKQGNCSVEDTVNVNVIWKPVIDAGANKAICLKDSVLLEGTYTHSSNNNIKFAWTPIDSVTTPTALQTYVHPVKSTYYKLTGTTDSLTYGCNFIFYDSVKVVIQQPIKAFAGNDTIAAKGSPHQLHGSGGLHYFWSSPAGVAITNATLQNAWVTLNNDANFYLTVKDAVGCEGRDTVFVKVLDGNTYHIPNSFTPNGDGLNDIFRAIPAGMANTQYFRVFNRLGQLIFETNQYLKGWDGTFKGKQQPNGTYVWMVKGTNKNNKTVEMQGTVNIIR